MTLLTWIYTSWGYSTQFSSFCGLFVFKQNIIHFFLNIFLCINWIYPLEDVSKKLQFSGQLFFLKKILKDFTQYIPLLKIDPLCGLILPMGIMIEWNLNVHFLRMLPTRFQLFPFLAPPYTKGSNCWSNLNFHLLR